VLQNATLLNDAMRNTSPKLNIHRYLWVLGETSFVAATFGREVALCKGAGR